MEFYGLFQGGFMQIRRNENSLFPNFKTNAAITNNKFLSMVTAKKQDVSVSVSISKSGREKARMLNEESLKNDDYMKNAETKIDRILDTIRQGGALSKEEEELVNNELKNMSEQKYKDYKDLRLSPEDVMEELKENYLRREKLFFDMQNQLEIEAKSQLDDFDTEKIMAYMQEKENDEEIIEMVKEYGEDEEETLEEESETKKAEEENLAEQEINLKVGDEPLEEVPSEDNGLKMRAMKKLEDIENQMDDVEEASAKARKEEHTFARNLEEDYKRMQQMLNSDEVSTKEKVKAYDRFVKDGYANAKGREVERIKKEFDAETLMMAKIMFLGRNRMDQMIDGKGNQGLIGTEFIKSFLI